LKDYTREGNGELLSFNTKLCHADLLVFDRKQLLKMKTKAIRSGTWFKAVQRIDRVLIDLTIKVKHNIRSTIFAKSILTITRKIESIMESKFYCAIHVVDLPLAKNTALTAQKLGNKRLKLGQQTLHIYYIWL